MTEPIAISLHRVSKNFKLPHEQYTGLKQALLNFRPGQKYEIQHVLTGLSFDIKKGEFFGIVGRNGSGKSTLLKLLAQIYSPNVGSVTVHGSLTPFIELGVGFNPELTGRENVYLNGALLGFDRQQMGNLYDEIVEFAELSEFMDQKLKNYSSGMQVRLAFSIAIRAKSDILLIDEVLAVGDAAFQRKCYDYFMLLKKTDTTVILVTHDMSAVRQYCDRAIMLEDGKIVTAGSPEEVAQAYQRLFSEDVAAAGMIEVSGPALEAGQTRWGSGKLRLERASATVVKQNVVLTCQFKSYEDLPPTLYGFTVHAPNDAVVMDGNTRRSKVKTPPTKAGDLIEITWEFQNIFGGGRHAVSVAACDMSATNYYDWFNEAISFNVIREEPTGGLVAPEIRTSPIKVS
ncbi:MAG TPA: ABC transporter ATP-binding protein [Candidatus Saccharimonadia bacterium]|nr:ABC transporter ATP-binding protein [Candidatus Saccharimonadia bacterium]